jgi:TonB family protein
MTRFLFASLLALFSQVLVAQRIYFSLDYWVVPKERGFFYSDSKDISKKIQLFYVDGDQLAIEGTVTSLDPAISWEGNFVTYYKNGKISSEGSFLKGAKAGTWKHYYESGQQYSEESFGESDYLYIQQWDEKGTPLLTNGTGIVRLNSDDTPQSYLDVVNNKVRSTFSVSDRDTLYSFAETKPEYPGGLPAMYQKIASTLRYPIEAKRAGIQGKVFIEFIVEEDGALTNMRSIKPIGGGCDEEAIRVLKSLKKWNPATVDGKPVKHKLVLPLTFRLD